ncbi:MAG TPA: hypothetical protein PLH57_01715 [Oligoflexia bacterium]|nr:hypothetical protein [Oligoflexia bacterium]
MKHSQKITILACAVAALATTPAFGSLNEIMKTYRGLRSLGMGGVAFTTGMYDEALFANPAMASEHPESRIEILSPTFEANTNLISNFSAVNDIKGSSGASAISKIADEGIAGENMHFRFTGLFGYYSPKLFGENTGFSFGLLTNLQANIMLRADADVDSQAYLDAGPNFGVSHLLMNGKLALGANLRAIYRLASNKTIRATEFLGGTKLSLSSIGGQGMGIDGDLGALYKMMDVHSFFKNLWFALSLNNVAQSTYRVAAKDLVSSVKTSPPRNNRTINTGVRTDLPDAWILSGNIFAIEVQDIGSLIYHSSFWKRLHIGGETKLTRVVSFRGGLNQGYLAAGFGFDLPVLNVEVATYGEEMGTNTGIHEDRRIALRLGVEI